LISFSGWVYGNRFGDGGSLVIWVLRVGEVPIAKVIVIDSGDPIAGSSAKGAFAVEVY
jgi:hypothetical protein